MAVAACALVGAMAVGGSLAYLTDGEAHTNKFTVGNVKIDLTETKWEEPEEPGVPNQEYEKNPQVTNTGKNDAIIFVTVDVPAEDITIVNEDGTTGTAKSVKDLFTFKHVNSGISTQFDEGFNTEDWIELTSSPYQVPATVAGQKSHYTFAYKTVVKPTSETKALFDKVQLKNFIEGEVVDGDNAKAEDIVVKAYAIQADSLLEDGAAIETSSLDEATLKKIFDIYVNQNGGSDGDVTGLSKTPAEADTNNSKKLDGTANGV